MAAYVKYNQFVEDLGRKVHNLNSDTLKVALTNTAPNVVTHKVLADITQISAGNGYASGGTASSGTSFAQSNGTAKLDGGNVVFTASGGTIGPFRYAVLYNATASGGPLIAYFDYGSALTLQDGEQLTVDFITNVDIFTLT